MTFTYFGYGSLVNADTIPAGTEVTPGRLKGWKREWRVCGTGENGLGRCALTVREDPGCEIRGVAVREPLSGLAALQAREKRYEMVEGIGSVFRCDAAGRPGSEGLFLFRASAPHYRWGTQTHPILQSYLDCVLAGYFRLWGEEGIDHFIETTDGWQVPVLADRHAPHYVRSVVLTAELADLIDGKLRSLGIQYLTTAV